MTTYMATYCNKTTDLQEVEPRIDRYDKKRLIQNWVTVSSNLYSASNVGYVGELYLKGISQSTPEATVGAVDANGEWFYDADLDKVTFYSTTDPSTVVMKAGANWEDLKEVATERASEIVRSYINRPIFKRSGTGEQDAQEQDYDWVIIHSTALIACFLLIMGHDNELAREYREQAMNPNWDQEEGGNAGWLDEIKDGTIKLWNEIGIAERKGDIRQVTKGDSSTGAIIDTMIGEGGLSIDYDKIKIKIGTGGTLVAGEVNSTITVNSYISSGDTLKYSSVLSEVYMGTDYMYVGHNLWVRFGAGVYTADDEWEAEVSNLPEEHGRIHSIDCSR